MNELFLSKPFNAHFYMCKVTQQKSYRYKSKPKQDGYSFTLRQIPCRKVLYAQAPIFFHLYLCYKYVYIYIYISIHIFLFHSTLNFCLGLFYWLLESRIFGRNQFGDKRWIHEHCSELAELLCLECIVYNAYLAIMSPDYITNHIYIFCNLIGL